MASQRCSAEGGIDPNAGRDIKKTPQIGTIQLPGSAFPSMSSRARVQTPPPLPWKLLVFSPGQKSMDLYVYLLLICFL